MKRAAIFFVVLLVLAPLSASADTLSPIEPTVAQLLTRVATLEALEAVASSSVPAACAAVTNTPTVTVNQTFILAWGSVGTMSLSSSSTASHWPLAGASTVSQTKPGVWVYWLDFYAQDGTHLTCKAHITVTAS